MTDITKYGAVGDGAFDCSPAIRAALEKETEIFFPEGTYVITETVRIPSNRHVKLDAGAVIFAADHCFDRAGDRAILTNADPENGNENIVFEGGKIDANNVNNTRADWVTGPSSGLTFCFYRVKGLTLRCMNLHNSDSYNIRLTRVEDYLIEDILFTSTHLPLCQDGVHVNGHCYRGVIRNIRGEGKCTNDDLIALNADDQDLYCHNWGQEDGPIVDLLIENVHADDCHTALRVLSIHSEIKNVTVRNLSAGVRCHGLNFDAARYCAHPIFSDEDHPDGVGFLKNVVLENITLWKTIPRRTDFAVFETKGKLTVKNLVRDRAKDQDPERPTLKFKSLPKAEITVNGERYRSEGETRFFDGDRFDIEIK